MATGRPVFLKYNYHQQQTYTGKRSPFFIKLKMAADKDGKLLAMEGDWTVDHGPYAEFGDALAQRCAPAHGRRLPASRTSTGKEGSSTRTTRWGCAFRAFGSPQAEFASEVLIDELAEKVGMDPLEFRYKNVYREGDTTPAGSPPDVIVLPGPHRHAAPALQGGPSKARTESTPEKKARGRHLDRHLQVRSRSARYVRGLGRADGRRGDDLRLLGRPRSGRRHRHPDHRPRVAAPPGSRPEKIRLVMNDMSLAPNSGPSGASRQQVVTGAAIKDGLRASSLKAMRKQDGSYRTYDEMIAESIPTKICRKAHDAGHARGHRDGPGHEYSELSCTASSWRRSR